MTGSDSKLFGRHIKTLPLVPACSLIILALQFFAVSTANAADFTGPVVSVLEGDTIKVLHSTRAECIRLNGIDCPNYSQVASDKQVAFNSAAEAEAARYRIAGNCLWVERENSHTKDTPSIKFRLVS